jgi:hypothetical protein
MLDEPNLEGQPAAELGRKVTTYRRAEKGNRLQKGSDLGSDTLTGIPSRLGD